MRRVASSAAEEVGYDPATRALDVRYAGGGLYRCFDVPPGTYAELVAAGPVGAFVDRRVKPRFRYARLA